MQIRLGSVIFRDSIKFTSASLAAMVESLKKSCDGDYASRFKSLAAQHPFLARSPESFELLLRKAPFPYTALQDQGFFTREAVLPREAYNDDVSGPPPL